MTFVLPQVQAFLEQLAKLSAGAPKMRDLPPTFGRQSYVGLVQLADRPAPEVPWHDDHIAGMPVRLYTPPGARTDACFLFFHGGGFVIGNLASHHNLAAEIAVQMNMRLAAVDYRLAPEHPFPAAHEDVFAVTEAVIAGALGPMQHIMVGGDSAGGNLAAAVAQRYRARIAAQLLLYPVTDHTAVTGSMERFAAGYVLERADVVWFAQQYVPATADARDPRLSPIFGDLAGLPPAVVLTCALDPLLDQGNAYAAAMAAAGTRVAHHVLEGLPHTCFQLRAALPAAQMALTQALIELRNIAR